MITKQFNLLIELSIVSLPMCYTLKINFDKVEFYMSFLS